VHCTLISADDTAQAAALWVMLGRPFAAMCRHRLPIRTAVPASTRASNLGGCPTSGRHDKATVGPVTVTGQQAVDGDVFIQRFPMNTARAEFELVPLFRLSSQEAGEPRERDGHSPAIVQIDPHVVVVESHRFS